MAKGRTVILAGLNPVGLQKISLANSTAVAINSTVRKAEVLDISVETNNVRYTCYSTAPTLTTGVMMFANTCYRFEGFNGTSLLRFQRSTGAAVVTVQGWKMTGGGH
jgi:hypothetical protein